jgi:hypothetical protein
MKISGIQHAPVADRPRDVQQARQAVPRTTTTPPEASQPTVEERMAKSAKQVGARIAAAVDSGALTTRQAQALSEVQKDFEKQLSRLASAMHGEGVSRHELNDGLSKVYGSLRDSLSAIFAAGKAQPFDPAHGTGS